MRKQRFLQLILLLFFFTCLPALAAVDPEGVSFRDRLRRLVESGEQQAFKALVQAEPALSKRAFVVEFLDVWEQREREESFPPLTDLVGLLAEAIGEAHADVKPSQIVDRYHNKKNEAATYELGRYAEDIYSPYEGTAIVESLNTKGLEEEVHYGAGLYRRAEFREGELSVLLPLVLNHVRLVLAGVYADRGVFVREFDLRLQASSQATERLKEAPNPDLDEWEKAHKQTEEMLTLLGQNFLVQTGLVSDFSPDTLAKLEEVGVEYRLPALVSRFQAAHRASRPEQAKAHLEAVEKLVSENSEDPPALYRFAIKTMKFQSRFEEASEEELVESFREAWNELDDYAPGVKIGDDDGWWVAKDAVKFWIDALSSLDESLAEEELERIHFALVDWLFEGRQNSPQDYYTTQELWMQSVEVGVYLTQRVAVLDLTSYLMESAGMDRFFRQEDVPEALRILESMTLSLGEYPAVFHLNYDGSPYPPLSFENSSLMRELKIRIAFLKAVAADDIETQVESLNSIVPNLQNLDRPESYIHYHQLLGREFMARERHDLAVPLLERAIEYANKYSFRIKEVELATLVSEAYSAQSDWEMALLYSERAKATLQSTLPSSAANEAEALGKQGRNAGELSAVAHLKSDNPKAAFEALSEGQQLQSAGIQLAANRTARGDLNSVASKQKSLEILERQAKSLESLPDSQTRTELLENNNQQLAKSRTDFMLESRRIRAKYPKLYTTTLRFDPLVLPDVQEGLPPGTAVIQYFATAHELFIFVVTGDSFHLHSVSLDQSELDELVLDYLKKLRRATPDDGDLARLSKRLSSLLIEPVYEDVAKSETLILIPSGRLNILPFASLLDESDSPLAARKRLVFLAKATDFMKISGSRPKEVNEMVAFANATLDLPSAQREGEKVSEMFHDSKLFVGAEATRENLLQYASGADVLHLATHGLSDPLDALNNYLALAGSGRLSQEEIFNLELSDTSLVTLSACNTALSNTTEYDFVASIAEAFWIAGSRSVVASVWSVDDDSTERLMTEFYRGLKEDGLGKAEALQKAQLAVRAEPRFQHPYFWAGFMLFGDYR